MALDQSKIAKVAAEQVVALKGQYGEECEIGDVCTVVEVIGPHGSAVRVASNAERAHVAAGLLRLAEATMLDTYAPKGRSSGQRD